MTLEDFKIYLPQYLSKESLDELFDNLKNFRDKLETVLKPNQVGK